LVTDQCSCNCDCDCDCQNIEQQEDIVNISALIINDYDSTKRTETEMKSKIYKLKTYRPTKMIKVKLYKTVT